jgi:rod shape determining protein RodA
MVFNLPQIKNFDWSLLIVATLLVLVGLSVIYSVTLSQAQPDYTLLNKQIIFSLVGLFLFFVFAFFDYRIIGSVAWIIYSISLLILVLVLFFGTAFHGTKGWFEIFGFTFQPVEFAKLGVIIFLAKFLSSRVSDKIHTKNIISSLILIFIPVTLVLLQPDLGSSIVLLACWLVMLWFSGLEKKKVIIMFFILLLIFIASWFVVLEDYQKERVLNFVDPGRDPLGQGYNVRQSIIAVGSGGLVGRGLGLGPQSQLRFLPETEADFIFASLAEELGLVGCLFVLILYSLFLFRFYRAVKIARDNFSQLLVLGVLTLFCVQIFINIGMSIGLLPVTGLPLPFISSGGSFLIISFIFLGIIESIMIKNKGVA